MPDKAGKDQNKSNRNEVRLLSAVKQVYAPGDANGHFDNMFKSMMEDQNHKILAHNKMLYYLCSKTGADEAKEIA